MAKMEIKGKHILITGCQAYWANITRPVQKFKAEPGVMQYEMDLIVPESVVDALQEANVNKSPKSVEQKNKDIQRKAKKNGTEPKNLYPAELEDHFILKLSTLAKWPSGDDKPLKVVYEGKPFKGNVGAGSVVDVILYLGKDNGDGHTVNLNQCRIQKLVEVEESSEGFDFETEDQECGFDDFDGGDNREGDENPFA